MKENLKNIRIQNHLTQKEIATKLNISRSTYNNYEQGVAEPDIETLKKLADIYHTTTDTIIGHEVNYLLDKSALSTEQKKVLEAIKKLSNENCKRVLDFITGIQIAEEEKQKIINLYKKRY